MVVARFRSTEEIGNGGASAQLFDLINRQASRDKPIEEETESLRLCRTVYARVLRQALNTRLRARFVSIRRHNASNCICLCTVVTRVAPRLDCSIPETNCVTRHLLPAPAAPSGQFSDLFLRIASERASERCFVEFEKLGLMLRRRQTRFRIRFICSHARARCYLPCTEILDAPHT